MSRDPSPERRSVLAVLDRARPEALTSDQVAVRTGLPLEDVRSHLMNLCAAGQAHRAGTARQRKTYRAGGRPAEEAQPLPIRPSTARGDYEGRELMPYTGRPGAMRAFELHSLENGQRVPRRRPTLMSTEASPWDL